MSFWIVLGGIALWLMFWALSPSQAARRIRRKKQEIYQKVPTYKVVDAATYRHLDQEFYRSFAEWFQSQGFRHLGDVDPGAPAIAARPVVARILVSDDGIVLASGFNLRLRKLLALLVPSMSDLHVIDIETEFDDGSFVITTTAFDSRHTTNPPQVLVKYFEGDTSPPDLLETHQRRVSARITEQRRCVPVHSLDDALGLQERLRLVKAGFELERDHKLDRDELVLMSRDVHIPGAREAAHDIADEMERGDNP